MKDYTDEMNPNETAWGELYTRQEEIVHAITHGVGIPLSIAALVLLVNFSNIYGNIWHVVSTTIYGSTLIILYTASTLYHGIPYPRVKTLLQKFDHMAIFLLIAGTYTPFTLITLKGAWGWTLFFMIWIMAALGSALELRGGPKAEQWSLLLYLVMGWLVLIAVKPLIAKLPPRGLALLLSGGLAYTFGTIFYVWERLTWNHAIWHLFVLAGSTLHFFAVLFYVIPVPS